MLHGFLVPRESLNALRREICIPLQRVPPLIKMLNYISMYTGRVLQLHS